MHREWFLGVFLAVPLAMAQTQVDLGRQSKDIDFAQAASTRPLKSGTQLPSTCAVGQMFYLTNAAPGANLYGCTAVNTWTLQGGTGSGVQSASQLADLQPVRTTSSVLTIGSLCSAANPCNVAVNGTTYAFTGPMTVSNSGSTGLTARGYISDGSDGQNAGTFVIANSAAGGVNCSGGCVVLNGATAFPLSSGVVTQFVWTATGVPGQWDSSGYTDWRAFQGGGNRLYSTNGNCTVAQSTAGTGLTCGEDWSALLSPTSVTNLFMNGYGTNYYWTDPSGGDANNHYGMQFDCNYDYNDTANYSYSDDNCLENTLNFAWGQGLYGTGTNAKRTAVQYNNIFNATGSGQRIMNNNLMYCYGMSDCARESTTITYADGPIAGDEGTGFSVISRVQQQGFLVKTTIASTPVRSACPSNMTLTQNVTASTTPQAVTVSSNAGCSVGDWLIADWTGPTAYPNWDAVQITAIGSGTITAKFTANHSSGATLLAGVVFSVANTQYFGQDRVLADLSGATYSTGTVSFTNSSGTITGTGTSWSYSMVGGNTLSPGCITAAAENQTGSPFSAGAPLRSYWEILANSISSGTSMGIYTNSVAGNAAYNGTPFSGSAFTVYPCGRVLMLSGNTVVLSPNTATWANGDTVELATVPYPDVTGFQYFLSGYTPGGSYRAATTWSNNGGQKFQAGIVFNNVMTDNNSLGNPAAWGCLLCIANYAANPMADWGINFSGTSNAFTQGSILLPSSAAGPNKIAWSDNPNNNWIGTDTNYHLNVCGVGQWNAGTAANCMLAAQISSGNSYAVGTVFNTNGIGIKGTTNAVPAWFDINTVPNLSGGGELLLHGAFYDSAPGWHGDQYMPTIGGFVMEYADQGGMSPLLGIGTLGTGGGGPLYNRRGLATLPTGVATSSNNYPSQAMGVAASIWNGSGESAAWALWDLEPDSNATNSTSHAVFYGPCAAPANPINRECSYFKAGLDGMTVFGAETANYYAAPLGSPIASASTIAPANYITHVTGTTPITTITPPASCSAAGGSCAFVFIPDAATVYNTGGNIANALTATVNVPVLAVYDNNSGKWYLR